jgi:hypothetical protein
LFTGSPELQKLEPSLLVEEQELAWDGGQELELGLTSTASTSVSVGSAARPTVIATVSLPAMSLQAAKVNILAQL